MRAARERPGGEGPSATHAEPSAPPEAVQPEARPGDAARAALRRANAERHSVGGTAEDPASPPASGDRYPAVVGDTAAPRESAPAARPGDAAREALRAARTEADRQPSAPRTRDVQTLDGSTTAGTRGRTRTRTRAGDARVQDVRELLAGAFVLPASQSGASSAAADAGGERGDAPSPPGQEAAEASLRRRRGTPDPPREPGGPPPAAARYPRSMAAPGRDGELRRTFAALPARAAQASERLAETWWGNAWVTALEEGALDSARLARGRTYAGRGNVDAITVTPGLVLAYVQGSRPRPYRVQVRLRTFSDDEWDRFLDAAAERPGHIAALLDKQVPQSLADCGVRLLPGPGDLEPRCSCPDFGHPCKHAAAVCYQTARLLDRDPFVLLLLRGRGERQLLDALSRRNAARAARAAQEREPAPVAGVRARDAVARNARPPLPLPLSPPAHPEQPPVYPGVPGGPDPFALDQLATDAAARAHALLTMGEDPVAELTLWQDAVRLASARPGSGLTAGTRALYASLAAATGRTPADLARAVAAWRQGGQAALAVLEEPWDPPAGRFDRARPLLLAADLPAFRPWRNRLTHPDAHVQLRLGQDGLWYAYESEAGREDWWPRGTPDLDPVGALTGLGAG
ncbi:SWIM zinc finger family protein [Streptomyces chiangmaiensis]|uniref:SWIM zinc finger family protein n=1 Tax=Streptomyces chiangmaiensis TaxID=766497 RepID=A0ABU7FAH2_9ACTN|nr:SWIM zinc finger family protein [Streptomyces chiangmaiensis]MED7820808.1 SWIM zinc finger family protein [Streptomyces chiangmaiensis]